MRFFSWEALDVVVHTLEFAAVILGAIFWIYKRKLQMDILVDFVHKIATNHLPHIYHGLYMIAQKLAIDLEEPPEINFKKLNGKDK